MTFVGHFLLTNLLTGQLIDSAPSRVVTVSAASHAMGTGNINLEDPMLTQNFSKMEAVMQSKLANIIFSNELGRRMKGMLQFNIMELTIIIKCFLDY